MSLADLKRKSSLSSITEKLDKADNSSNKKDDRFWTPEVDKNGNGRATIRFLPAPDGEDAPFVKIYNHGFQGPSGLWYIENSLTTLGQEDPVSAYNSKLWATGSEKNKEIARKQKRKLSFISNILVVDDPAAPENNGKVFLYRYGKTIFDMIKEAAEQGFDEFEPFNAFDPFDGANFKIAIRHVDNYRKYDRSKFIQKGPISENEDEIVEIWNKTYPLQPFLDQSNFKSYKELEEKLYRVLDLKTEEPSSKIYSSENDSISNDLDEDSVEYDSSEETPPWKDRGEEKSLDDIFSDI